MTVTISIDRMAVHAPIGVYDFEKRYGNDFEVTATVVADIPADRLEADDLEATLNYAEVAAIVNDTMQQPLDLIETAALRVARAVRDYGHTRGVAVMSVTVSVAKLRPPIEGLDVPRASATVTI